MKGSSAKMMAILGLGMFIFTLFILSSLVSQTGKSSLKTATRSSPAKGSNGAAPGPGATKVEEPAPVEPDYCGTIKMPFGWTTPEMLAHWENPSATGHEGQPDDAKIHVNATFVSIIYVTKRPGSYDIILNSLAQQTDSRFEIIFVDELATDRAEDIIRYAHQVGIHRVAVMESKPKPEKYKDHKFSIANALNTGYLLASGPISMSIMDYAWAPSTLIARTIEFYGQNEDRQLHLLAYPEIHYGASNHFESMVPNWVHNGKLLTIFKTPVCKLPSLRKEGINWGGFYLRPEDVIKDESRRDFEKQLSCATLSTGMAEEVNGVDERLDVGDDCHEANMRQRAEARLNAETWTDGSMIVEQLFHRFQEDPDMWSRSAKNTNLFGLHGELINEVVKGGSLKAPNDFDMHKFHENKCYLWWGKKQRLVEAAGTESTLRVCADNPIRI